MFSSLLALLRHRVTWRFLIVLGATTGFASITEHLSELETITCSLFTCLD